MAYSMGQIVSHGFMMYSEVYIPAHAMGKMPHSVPHGTYLPCTPYHGPRCYLWSMSTVSRSMGILWRMSLGYAMGRSTRKRLPWYVPRGAAHVVSSLIYLTIYAPGRNMATINSEGPRDTPLGAFYVRYTAGFPITSFMVYLKLHKGNIARSVMVCAMESAMGYLVEHLPHGMHHDIQHEMPHETMQ